MIPAEAMTLRFERFARSRAKRVRSRALATLMRLRNRYARASVLGEAAVAVSLTSYGQRIDSVALAIESIARGAVKPKMLVLWLDDVDSVDKLPESLKRLMRRGLEVRFTEDLGPHKKYYPYVAALFPHRWPLATADDDVVYPRRWLHDLCSAHTARPGEVHCHLARVVALAGSRIERYETWPTCQNTSADPRHFAIGVSGVIYPPSLLDVLAQQGRGFLTACPTADDVWLHHTALRNGFRVRQVRGGARHFPILPRTQTLSLKKANVDRRGNDHAISAVYQSGDVDLLRSSVGMGPRGLS